MIARDRVRRCTRAFEHEHVFGKNWRERVDVDSLDPGSDFGLQILEQIAGNAADGIAKLERVLGKNFGHFKFGLFAADGDTDDFDDLNAAWLAEITEPNMETSTCI